MTKEESEPGEAPERDRRCVRLDELTIAERERVRAMERLANAPDRVMSSIRLFRFLRSFGEIGHDRWLIQPRHEDASSEGDLWMGGVMWRSGCFFVPSENSDGLSYLSYFSLQAHLT